MHGASERPTGHGTGSVLEFDQGPFKGLQLKTPCTCTEVGEEAFPDSHIVNVGRPETVSEESRKDGTAKNVGVLERLELVVGPVGRLLLRDPGSEEFGWDEPEK